MNVATGLVATDLWAALEGRPTLAQLAGDDCKTLDLANPFAAALALDGAVDADAAK